MPKLAWMPIVAALLGTSPLAAQASEAQTFTDTTVVTGLDITHLRMLASSFGLETVVEENKPGSVRLGVRVPGEPAFNLLATTCESEDRLSNCQALVVRLLFGAEDGEYTPTLLNEMNRNFSVAKATLLPDGRLQIDRLIFVSGGVTIANLGENIQATYATFAPADKLIAASKAAAN